MDMSLIGIGSVRARIADLAPPPGWLALGACASLLLTACEPEVPPVPALARQCLLLGSGRPVVLSITARTGGTLRATIEEHGIATIAELDDEPASVASSPLDRVGTIVLTGRTLGRQIHSIWARATDSPEITGEVCVSAEVIPERDRTLAQAANDLAAAGRATQQQDWNTAFARYLDAARRLDHLGRRQESASARQALAELTYRRLDRKRDSYALAAEALEGYSGAADPVLRGLLAGLQAKALIDMPGVSLHSLVPAIRERLRAARRLVAASPSGTRELPRLDILDGFLAYRTDQRHQARTLWTRAAERCQQLRDWGCYGLALQNSGQLAKENRSYDAALDIFEDALRRLPPDLDPKLSATIWNNLGLLQGEVGLFSSSERSYAAAMRTYTGLEDCDGARRSLSLAGVLMVQVGTLADAQSYLAQAASLDCPSLLAAARRSSGDSMVPVPAEPSVHPEAADPRARPGPCAYPLDPEALTTENKNVVFNSLLSLGDAQLLQSETQQAGLCLDAAQRYATTPRTRMRLANARGNMLLERADAAAALAAFSEALRIADEARLPPTYEHRGVAQLGIVRSHLLAGQNDAALAGAEEALKTSITRGDIDQTVASLRLIAAASRASGQLAQAQQTLSVAVDLIEAVPIDELNGEQRATYLSTQHAVFAELTDLLTSQVAADPQSAWPAFFSSERGRARSLRFATSQTTHDSAHATRSTARYQQLLHEVVALPATADATRSLAGLLEKIDRAAQRQRDPAAAVSMAQLGEILGELHATLVEYAVGDRDLFAFVVTPGSAIVVRLGDVREMADPAASLRGLVRDAEAPLTEVHSAARSLAQRILWPLSGYLNTPRVIFVPDDALHTIPFTLLPWSASSGAELLVQHVESAIVPSATFLTSVRLGMRPHTRTPRIELIGDPVFRVSDWARECAGERPTEGIPKANTTRTLADWTESLPRLPGTRAEIATIAKVAQQSRPRSHIETLLGCAAVPDALRRATSEDVQLLHIATHAHIDAQRPRLSALALSPGPAGQEASSFSLLDILGLKLSYPLVVLSACDTSRGRLLPGEGVLGPAQAFLQAGASTVIASYWRVEDQHTSAFMQQFYSHLLGEGLTAASALRTTQLEAVRTGKSLDWAAFALYGRPDSTL
jgi:CHAT domain-containing protein